MCIEVKASFSFPSSINVIVLNGETLEDSIVPIMVEYQSRPPSCPSCNVFGHSPLKCPKANYQWIPKAKPAIIPNPHASSSSAVPVLHKAGTLDLDSLKSAGIDAANDWVTVSRGARVGNDPVIPSTPIVNFNSFSPIASSGDGLLSPGSIPLDANDPLVAKLKVIDEKEGKDLKQKLRTESANPQAAKKRNKGKGKLSNPSSS